MDMLLRSHLLISFPQVGGRATELPSLGRRSGDALQPLQEQAHTDGLLPWLLTEQQTTRGACCEPKMQLLLLPHTEVSLLTHKHLASQKKSFMFVYVLAERVLLGYPLLARTGKSQSSQQLLALSEPHMLSKAREMLSSQDTPVLIDRAWSPYPDLPHSKGRQRLDAH